MLKKMLLKALSRVYQGMGSVLMFHRILPEKARSRLNAVRGLEVSESFFVDLVERYERAGYQWLSLDALYQRILGEDLTVDSRPFVVLSFDDAYIDNLEYVAPFLRKKGIPWSVFVSPGLSQGQQLAWWYGLESIAMKARLPRAFLGGWDPKLSAWPRLSPDQRYQLLREHFWLKSARKDFDCELLHWFGEEHIDLRELSKKVFLNLDQIRELYRLGVNIGAHAMTHKPLALLEYGDMAIELADSKRILEATLNADIKDLAFPFGDKKSAGRREFEEAETQGFRMALTTRHGHIFSTHQKHLHVLPRVNVSGHYLSFDHYNSRINGLIQLRHQNGRRLYTH